MTCPSGKFSRSLLVAWTAASAPPETPTPSCCGCSSRLRRAMTCLLAHFAVIIIIIIIILAFIEDAINDLVAMYQCALMFYE